MTKSPQVSVVIPAYNAAWCINGAVDSVLAQTFRDFELIVVNDGSTDDTEAILNTYAESLRIVSKPNGGMSSARNAGIREARGQYIAFLDSDDHWLPGKLAQQVELLETQADIVFCSATARLQDMDGKPVGTWACTCSGRASVTDVFTHHVTIAGGASSVLARTAVVKKLGGFDEALFGAEDTDLWIRLAGEGGYACLDEPLVVVLKRAGSVSRNRSAMRAGALAMTRKNRHLLPPDKRGAYWRSIYAGVLCDYAKWAWRDGSRRQAIMDLLRAAARSPMGRGRLVAGLLADMLRNRAV